jgi:predicted secreted protein
MTWSLGTATYFIIWWVLLFAILPFGVQSQRELDDIVPGTEPGAPARPRLLIKLATNTVLAAILWAIFDYFYVVYFVPR